MLWMKCQNICRHANKMLLSRFILNEENWCWTRLYHIMISCIYVIAVLVWSRFSLVHVFFFIFNLLKGLENFWMFHHICLRDAWENLIIEKLFLFCLRIWGPQSFVLGFASSTAFRFDRPRRWTQPSQKPDESLFIGSKFQYYTLNYLNNKCIWSTNIN